MLPYYKVLLAYSIVKAARDVDSYIAMAPKEVRGKLRKMRAAIRKAVPKAKESISYRMPYYSYNGRLAWFSSMKNHIGLYLRPPAIEKNKKYLAGYVTTKSAIHFPPNKKLPIGLIKRLVKYSAHRNQRV